MLGSNRSRFDQAVIVCAIVVGIGFYWWMFYDMGASSARNEERAKIERAHYAADTPNRAAKECAGLDSAAQLKCIAEIIDAQRENRRNESDLAAQWKAANWVMWATILAGIQLISTLIGLYYVKRTLDATLEAVEDTGDATKAMIEANKIASERSHLELRPYLSHVDEGTSIIRNTEWDQSGKDGDFVGFRIAIVIKNSGSTPARNVTWSYAFETLTNDFQVVKFPALDGYNKCFDIAPGDITTQITPFTIKQNILDQVEADTVSIHAFARMTYDGLDNVSHTLQFRLICNKIMMSEGIWAIAADHYIST